MTVSYNYDVSSASMSNFFKIVFRWKGSIFKNIRYGIIIWIASYFSVSITYHYILQDHQEKNTSSAFWNSRCIFRFFNKLAEYCDTHLNYIPLQFLLGFFVSIVIDRWKQIFYNMGYIETVALTISGNLWGQDQYTKLQRRTIVRYLVLTQVLLFRNISMSVRRRFPNMGAIVTAGFAHQHEIEKLEKLTFDYERYWIPINWAMAIVKKAEDEGKFDASSFKNAIVVDICKFRKNLSQLCIFDWIPIPLSYLQVVFVAVRAYFFICLISRQFLTLENPDEQIIDYYFPYMTVLQFVFLFGWLKVAEDVLSPMGEKDDDFDLNQLIDKNMAIGLEIVDKTCHNPPKMEEDIFMDNGFVPIYSLDSAYQSERKLTGSVQNVQLAAPNKLVKMMEVIPNAPPSGLETSITFNTAPLLTIASICVETNGSLFWSSVELVLASQTTLRRRLTSAIMGQNRLNNIQLRPVNLGTSLPANVNLHPDRPKFDHDEDAPHGHDDDGDDCTQV